MKGLVLRTIGYYTICYASSNTIFSFISNIHIIQLIFKSHLKGADQASNFMQGHLTNKQHWSIDVKTPNVKNSLHRLKDRTLFGRRIENNMNIHWVEAPHSCQIQSTN